MFKRKRWILFNDLLVHCKRKRAAKRTGEVKKCKVSQYLMLEDVRVEVVVEPLFFLEEGKGEEGEEGEEEEGRRSSPRPRSRSSSGRKRASSSSSAPIVLPFVSPSPSSSLSASTSALSDSPSCNSSIDSSLDESEESEKKGGYYGCRVRGPGLKELFIFCKSESTRDAWCQTVQKHAWEAREALAKRSGRTYSPSPSCVKEFTTPQSMWALAAESTEKGGPRLRRMLSVTSVGGSEKKMSSKQLKRAISSGKYLSKKDDDGFWHSGEKDGQNSPGTSVQGGAGKSPPPSSAKGKPNPPKVPVLEVSMDPRNRRMSIGGKFDLVFGKGSKTERDSERETPNKVFNPLLSDRQHSVQTPGRGNSPLGKEEGGTSARRRKKAKRTLISRDDL